MNAGKLNKYPLNFSINLMLNRIYFPYTLILSHLIIITLNESKHQFLSMYNDHYS